MQAFFYWMEPVILRAQQFQWRRGGLRLMSSLPNQRVEQRVEQNHLLEWNWSGTRSALGAHVALLARSSGIDAAVGGAGFARLSGSSAAVFLGTAGRSTG